MRKDQRGSDVASRADGTEDIGILLALISGLAWTAATLSPLIDKTVLLWEGRNIDVSDRPHDAYVACRHDAQIFLAPNARTVNDIVATLGDMRIDGPGEAVLADQKKGQVGMFSLNDRGSGEDVVDTRPSVIWPP